MHFLLGSRWAIPVCAIVGVPSSTGKHGRRCRVGWNQATGCVRAVEKGLRQFSVLRFRCTFLGLFFFGQNFLQLYNECMSLRFELFQAFLRQSCRSFHLSFPGHQLLSFAFQGRRVVLFLSLRARILLRFLLLRRLLHFRKFPPHECVSKLAQAASSPRNVHGQRPSLRFAIFARTEAATQELPPVPLHAPDLVPVVRVSARQRTRRAPVHGAWAWPLRSSGEPSSSMETLDCDRGMDTPWERGGDNTNVHQRSNGETTQATLSTPGRRGSGWHPVPSRLPIHPTRWLPALLLSLGRHIAHSWQHQCMNVWRGCGFRIPTCCLGRISKPMRGQTRSEHTCNVRYHLKEINGVCKLVLLTNFLTGSLEVVRGFHHVSSNEQRPSKP